MTDISNCTEIIYNSASPLSTICTPQNSQYGYDVAFAPGLAFTIIFGLIVLAHLIQVLRYRKQALYMLVALVCALGEAGGWASRLYSSFFEFDFNGYAAQLVLLIISPVFISAVTYVVFCRVMDIVGHQWSRIPKKWYVGMFVVGDVVSLVIQAAGGGLSATANTPSSADTGKSIMIAGVAVQVVVTCIFFLLLIDYLITRRLSKAVSMDRDTTAILCAVFVATIAIAIRCIFRVIEMSQGWKGNLATNEAYLIAFDGVPLTVATLIFAVNHPGHFLKDRTSPSSQASSMIERDTKMGSAHYQQEQA